MPKFLLFLLALVASAPSLFAQKLLVDHRPTGAAQLGLPKDTPGFLADDFEVGVAPEVWIIDHVRIWAAPDPKAASPHGLGDLFQKISLYGGIAPDLPAPGQKPAVECDCHNLPPLQSATLQPGGDSTDNPAVRISAIQIVDGLETWQIDFEDLKWSVPAATRIQFGVLAEGRQIAERNLNYSWFTLASSAADGGSPAEQGGHLRIFSTAGKLQASFAEAGPARMNLQVWAHLLAKVSIRNAGPNLRVILRGEPFLDATKVDTASLRFGPLGASPERVAAEDTDHDGKPDLVMYFQAGKSGVEPKNVNACLIGRRLDGAPFEGCDLLHH